MTDGGIQWLCDIPPKRLDCFISPHQPLVQPPVARSGKGGVAVGLNIQFSFILFNPVSWSSPPPRTLTPEVRPSPANEGGLEEDSCALGHFLMMPRHLLPSFHLLSLVSTM